MDLSSDCLVKFFKYSRLVEYKRPAEFEYVIDLVYFLYSLGLEDLRSQRLTMKLNTPLCAEIRTLNNRSKAYLNNIVLAVPHSDQSRLDIKCTILGIIVYKESNRREV